MLDGPRGRVSHQRSSPTGDLLKSFAAAQIMVTTPGPSRPGKRHHPVQRGVDTQQVVATGDHTMGVDPAGAEKPSTADRFCPGGCAEHSHSDLTLLASLPGYDQGRSSSNSGGLLGACAGAVIMPTIYEAAAVPRRTPERAAGRTGRPARCLGSPGTTAQLLRGGPSHGQPVSAHIEAPAVSFVPSSWEKYPVDDFIPSLTWEPS